MVVHHLPGAGHQAARRVVQHGANVNLHVAPPSDGLPVKQHLLLLNLAPLLGQPFATLQA